MDSEDKNSADAAPLADSAGPGATLRAAREARRLDLGHIAAETRIPRRHLEAIEADNYESLPSRAYAIGFTRTYARVLGLDDAAIVEAVRAELADGSMRRTVPQSGMEPGDPARLPSSGLAWAAAGAVLILAVGIFAFYNSYFGAGTGPASLLPPETEVTPTPAAEATPADAATPAPSGPVVLTALEDGIWVRLFEEGGERLAERTLARGETLEVPVTARDPRLNTGRPDALAITIGGQPTPRLAERAQTISGAPVSAAALAARTLAQPAGAATPGAAVAPRPLRRTAPTGPATGDPAGPVGTVPPAASAPAPAEAGAEPGL